MKSQLNAKASKLIHSGQTNKFTSINTKDNRIEFRSPGGDYLSDIANNPKKLQDTINRMVVTMDAAMDPNKYKQEYQKKLYKLLTGQESGREGSTGAKKEMKASDKDLLNIFSRYAAGELPRAALKSFVRQAQLQRKVDKGDNQGKMW
jgi:non-homologous end joining protein Ku